MIRLPAWQTWLAWLGLGLAGGLLIRADVSLARWVERLSREGSPPPALDAHSATGYVERQRHFLGLRERGDTYRWIAATQELLATGPAASPTYDGDNVPVGRPQLLPRLYAFWLAAVSWGVHLATGGPLALSVERAALWEPVIAHVLVFAAAAAFMWARHGPASAVITGFLLVLFPPVAGQFLPGVLTPRTWALMLSAYAIALQLPPGGSRKPMAFSTRSAAAAGLALWLDPALGFPAVLVSVAAALASTPEGAPARRSLRWSLVGLAVTVAGWLIDQSPWRPAAGELRYVHPLYGLAWLGLGLGVHGWQRWRTPQRRRWHLLEAAAGLLLIAPLAWVQSQHGYKAWLYPSAAMRRLTSLDETVVFDTAFAWLTRATLAEIVFVGAPAAGAVATLVVSLLRRRERAMTATTARRVPVVVLGALLALVALQVRWLVIVSLVALPLIWNGLPAPSPTRRKVVAGAFAAFLFGLLAWGKSLPAALARPSGTTAPEAADLQALLHRHFSHWIASHYPAGKIAALAPPELSDSIVFHGGGRVLMSTAWESYPGQVAASRILSAPEATEAEAVLQSRELTHLIVPSWDRTLPLLVREPEVEGKDSFYARLQRWVLPRYLRPIPYHLPRIPGFLDQQLAVFRVVFPQDEALALSRLAEYFVEMNRPEPAGLAAEVLAESFPDDPNAAIARALVYAQAGKQSAFEQEATRLAAEVAAGRAPVDWDRRVQRAIALALARRHDAAKSEIGACLAEATANALYDLTPLAAYRLHTLAAGYELSFPTPDLAQLAAALGAEYLDRKK